MRATSLMHRPAFQYHSPVSKWRAVLWTAGAAVLLTVPALLAADVPVPTDSSINWSNARQFWSFRPPVTQLLAGARDGSWPRERLDYFVLDRLEKAGLLPSQEADRHVLIRRVTFDLTGLPPTPEEVESFVIDARSDAYERVVDRLLRSPAFGERMASMWLPLARYAEDQAHQVGDDTQFFYPNAYKYRQWVIDAFNRDLPYDQFITLQLAADRVPDPTPEDLPALGFLGLGPKYYNRGRLDVQADEWEDRVDTTTRTFLGLTVACARCHDHKFDPITQADYYALAGVFASTKMVNETPEGKMIEKMTADKMPADTMHVVEDGDAKDLNVFLRGSVENKGPVVPRRFLRILCNGDPKPFHEGSGRLELAAAIASRDNPLTARVMVNRAWGLLFGKPIVPTPSNFGHSGMLPTYPKLLDDLAVRFMDNGWSIKSLVREIVLSATYRQGSQEDTSRSARDPGNDLLWRMNRRRLTIEQWRDATLAVCGQLDSDGGKSMELDDPKNLRRTVYARISRLKLNDLLAQFDYPDANVHADKRAVTITPMQKLFLLNSRFMFARAHALAEALTNQSEETDAARVTHAYRLLFARDPQTAELDLALRFLGQPTTSELSRWEQYAQMLLACDEMLYVD